MLTRILDTSKIDIEDPQIRRELNQDLRRMDRLKHVEMPDDVDTFKVKVKPSSITYHAGLHRFVFELQYGNMVEDEFKPKGEVVSYQTETLPMI